VDPLKFGEYLKAIERKPALFVTYGRLLSIWQVKITSSQIGSVGFEAQASVIKTQGLLSGTNPWNFKSAWADFSVSSAAVLSDKHRWRVFHDPKIVARTAALVASLPAGKTYQDDIHQRPAPRKSRFITLNDIGPVYQEVFIYIRNQDSKHYLSSERVSF
jgi:hypothetical protein